MDGTGAGFLGHGPRAYRKLITEKLAFDVADETTDALRPLGTRLIEPFGPQAVLGCGGPGSGCRSWDLTWGSGVVTRTFRPRRGVPQFRHRYRM